MMPKQVVFILQDDEHSRFLKYVDDKHVGYEAKKAYLEWLNRREARDRRRDRERVGLK